MNVLITRRFLVLIFAGLAAASLLAPSAHSTSSVKLRVFAPAAGKVPVGPLPVHAKLSVKRSLKVRRARFYLNGKLVTTDRRYPFKIKKGVKFDTRRLGGVAGTITILVRYERWTRGGRLKKRTLKKKLRITPSGTIGTLAVPRCPPPLLLCEEFNDSSLDPTVWNTQRHDPDSGSYPWLAWNGNEGAHYSPDNVAVGDGVMTLTVTDVPSGTVSDSPDTHLRPQTTGSVNTDGKFVFEYGTLEARIKVDGCAACWQSFWLFSADHSHRPEIDVMEFTQMLEQGRSPNTVLHGLVGPPPVNGVQTGGETWQLAGTGADLTGGWHTYRVERRPASMTITIDDNANWSKTTTDPNYVTGTPMFLIMSMAIGDQERGAAMGLNFPRAPAGTKMQVDYVRAWPDGAK